MHAREREEVENQKGYPRAKRAERKTEAASRKTSKEQRAYMARIYADPEKHRKNLERHRELVCRTRQYLPDSKVMKARREREADGYPSQN